MPSNSLLFCLIPLALGFGIYPLLLPVAILTFFGLLLARFESFLGNFQDSLKSTRFLLFLAFLCLFLGLYWGAYIPYRPQTLKMPWGYFPVILTLSLFTVLWIGVFRDHLDHIQFTWWFSIGALLFGLGTVGAALILQPPPYYGNVIDIRYLPFGLKKFINTPGISNLLCLFPITFLAALLLSPGHRPKWFWAIGTIGFAFSLGAGLALGQRSYFVVALVIEPIIIAIFLLLLKSWKPLAMICSLLASYPLLRWIDKETGTNFLYRPLDQNLFNDARFQMLKYWIEHFISNPLQRIDVGPPPWDIYPWFHNFFADIHRLSGFWALLAAVVLIAFIFYQLLRLINIDKRFGLFLTAIAIPCFLIMNTSVVPEGENQPFLLLLAIGAIAVITITREKSPPNQQISENKT